MLTHPPTGADLFALVTDGPRIVAAYELLTRANAMAGFAASNQEAREKRQAMLNHPMLTHWLPRLAVLMRLRR